MRESEMLKLVLEFILTALLILMLFSQRSSGSEINLQPSPFACLDRSQKERIAICFEENFQCHEALAKVQPSPAPDWEIISLMIAGGIIGGMILDAQLHH